MLLAAPAAASADTLIVTWDQNPDPNVTAYRVYIGTATGRYTETFDVPGIQTSFVYSSAVAGKRYYVAVAAQVDHTMWGPRSAEVSGTAPAALAAESSALVLGRPAAIAGVAAAWAGDSGRAASTLQVIATGLEPVSALAVSAAGVGLFVEGGHVVRVFETPGQGLQAAPALASESDVQIQDIALDPAFDRTGRAFLAVSRTGRDGTREVAIERHRLLGGGLGESLTVVPVLDGALSARTLLAVTGDGRVIVAQPGNVRAFAGSAPTRLGEGPAQPASVIWDDVNQAVWLTGVGAAGTAIVERLGNSDAQREVVALPATLADAVPVAHLGTSGRIAVAGASGVAVVDFDPATGAATSLPANLAAYGTPVLVSLPTVGGQWWYVVLRASRPGGSTTDTLVRVAAARSSNAQPIH